MGRWDPHRRPRSLAMLAPTLVWLSLAIPGFGQEPTPPATAGGADLPPSLPTPPAPTEGARGATLPADLPGPGLPPSQDVGVRPTPELPTGTPSVPGGQAAAYYNA